MTVVTHPPTPRVIRRSRLQNFVYRNAPVLGITLVLVALIVGFSVTTPSFFSSDNFLNLLQQNAATLIVATAMTFVITTGGIDLSVGSTVALTSALSATMLEHSYSQVLTIVAMLGLGLLVGAVNGWFSSYQGIPAFIVTLASLSAVRGIALLVTLGYTIAIDPSLWFVQMGQGQIGQVPISAIIALGVAALGWIALTQTKYGQYVIGIGSNAEAVRRAGVNIRIVKLSVYALSGMAAALAGMEVAARLGSGSANAAVGFELQVITAVVLGGTDLFGGRGTIVGTVLGTLTIGVIGNGLILLHVNAFAVPVVQGAILLLAIWANTKVLSRFGAPA